MKKLTQIMGLAGLVILCLGAMVGLIQQKMSVFVSVQLVAGLGLSVLGLLSNIGEIRQWLSRRSVRMGPQVLLQGILLLVIIFFLNVLVQKFDLVKDFTRRHLFTLSPATDEVMANLPGTVKVIAFFPGGGPTEGRQRLQLYASQYSKMDLRFIDPDKNEDVARAEEVPPQPGVLFKYQEKKVWITKYEESDLTNAFIKVTRTSSPRVWFTIGHGEPDLDSDGPNGLAFLRQMLEKQGYTPERIDLNTVNKIPDNVSMVALVGLGSSMTRQEVSVLDYYLGQGGNAIIFLDPVWEQGAITGLEAFLEPYGIRPGWNLVFDPKNHLAGDQVGLSLVINDFSDHPITEGLTQPRAVFYMSRTLEQATGVRENITLYPLAKSSEDSYERLVDPRVLTTFTDEEERKKFIASIMEGRPGPSERRGPFTLAFAVTKDFELPAWKSDTGKTEKWQMRLVMLGTSTLCRNGSIFTPYNHELVMNAFNWLAGEDDLKVIRSPRRSGTRMYLDENQKNRVLYLSVMILPEIVMIIGLAAWWRRR